MRKISISLDLILALIVSIQIYFIYSLKYLNGFNLELIPILALAFMIHILFPKKNSLLGIVSLLIVLTLFLYISDLRFDGSYAHRHGIDVSGVLSSIEFLISGGLPFNHNSVPISPEASQHLEKAFRWGLPLISYGLTSITNIDLILLLQLTVCLTFGILIYLSAEHFQSCFNLNKWQKLAYIFIAVINPISLWTFKEGFYPQLISYGFFALSAAYIVQYLSNKDPRYIFSIYILMFTTAVFYIEGAVFIFIWLVGSFFIYGVMKYGTKEKIKYFDIVFYFILAAIIFHPFIQSWFEFIFNNLGNAANVGYIMPSKLLITDLLGISNIFSDSSLYFDDAYAVRPVKYGTYNIHLRTILSLLILYFIYKYRSNLIRQLNTSEIVPLIVLIVGFFGIMFSGEILRKILDAPKDYFQVKLTSFLYIISAIMILKLIFSSKFKKILIPTYFFFYALSLVLFINDSNNYESKVYINDLKDVVSRTKLINEYIFVGYERGKYLDKSISKMRYVDRTNDSIIASIIQKPFMDQWNVPQWNSLPGNRTIAVITLKDRLSSLDDLDVISMNDQYVIYKTDKSISDHLKTDDPIGSLYKSM